MTAQKEIEAEAKHLLKKFSRALHKIKEKEKEIKPTTDGMREEGPGETADPEFKKSMFANAPKTDNGFIIAEKKKW